MSINMKSARFTKFNFTDISAGEVTLRCSLQFTSQIPEGGDSSNSQRAILLSFISRVDGSDNTVLLDIEMRAVFDLEERNLHLFDEAPPSEYCKDTYRVFVEKTNFILGTMGIDGLTIPSSIDI